MSPTSEQIAQAEAEEREAEAFVDAQRKAADAWLAAEWPGATDETRAAVRSAWTELAGRCVPSLTDEQIRMEMVVCPDCGCKRCPHAENHANACTGRMVPTNAPNGMAHTCSGCEEARARLAAAVTAAGVATDGGSHA